MYYSSLEKNQKPFVCILIRSILTLLIEQDNVASPNMCYW